MELNGETISNISKRVEKTKKYIYISQRKMLATKREEIERKENERGSRMDILAR